MVNLLGAFGLITLTTPESDSLNVALVAVLAVFAQTPVPPILGGKSS